MQQGHLETIRRVLWNCRNGRNALVEFDVTSFSLFEIRNLTLGIRTIAYAIRNGDEETHSCLWAGFNSLRNRCLALDYLKSDRYAGLPTFCILIMYFIALYILFRPLKHSIARNCCHFHFDVSEYPILPKATCLHPAMFTSICSRLHRVLTPVIWVLHHIAVYLWDSKSLRKYPGLNALCGVTNLVYIFEVERCKGFRTRSLAKGHKRHEIIRLGPNSLSFENVKAIKDIYGHSTPCIKGDMHSTTTGFHRSLLDRVGKQEHSEKRKRLPHSPGRLGVQSGRQVQ